LRGSLIIYAKTMPDNGIGHQPPPRLWLAKQSAGLRVKKNRYYVKEGEKRRGGAERTGREI
jgi:hypothetical protein